MLEKRPGYRKPSQKHQPPGLFVLYEDRDIIVANKSNGLLTISTTKEHDNTAYCHLTNYVRKGNKYAKDRIFIVHRLDRETSGILVFAKSEKAKIYLQENWQEFTKTYYAVVQGTLEKKEDIISSYLMENSIHIMYSTKNSAEGKLAKTGYKVIKESRNFSLLEIKLFTGRKNQIRVHMADIGHPVAGDRVYGNKERNSRKLALHAASLSILHPFTKKEMTFEAKPPVFFNALMQKPQGSTK